MLLSQKLVIDKVVLTRQGMQLKKWRALALVI